jgi:hypothetical protein
MQDLWPIVKLVVRGVKDAGESAVDAFVTRLGLNSRT